jgi:hypothetical protein
LRKSCGRGIPDWRVIPAGCEVCRKEILSQRIIISEELQARLNVWGAWCHLGRASGNALSLFSLEFSTYGRDTTLEECGDGFQCGHYVGWFRVESGGAACSIICLYMSIRLSDVGTGLSTVITWVGLGLCAAEPHHFSSCVRVNET